MLRDGKLVGIVTRGNLLQGLATLKAEPPSTSMTQPFGSSFVAELKDQPWAHLYTDDIVVENSVVHLHGTVRTEDERRALRIAAENVPGVQSVEDHLMVSAPPPI